MGKKKLIEVISVIIEDKLDSNGALRNVAVSDAWKRLRQNIEVSSWKTAESILQELSDNLQKINLLKSMSPQFTKLKAALQNPDQMVEETEYLAKENPKDNKQTLNAVSEMKAVREGITNLSKCLLDIKVKLEKDGDVPEKIDVPRDISDETKSCYNAVAYIYDKFRRGVRDIEHLKMRVENGEKRNKDLEKEIDDKEERINKLTLTVDTLEQKHSGMKEEKMEAFKDQMKLKGLERQVSQKDAQLDKLKQELKELTDRLGAMVNARGDAIEDALNPVPPSRVAEMFADIYKTEWTGMLTYLKREGKSEQDATEKMLKILKDAYQFAEAACQRQLQRLANDFVCSPIELPLAKLNLQESEIKQLNVIRRQTSKISCEQTKTAFITHLEESGEAVYTLQEITDMMSYIEKCIDVCWFMCLQTPSLNLDLRTTSDCDVDKTKYDVTSGKGSKVKYVIWPTLFKGSNGEILTKGKLCAK